MQISSSQNVAMENASERSPATMPTTCQFSSREFKSSSSWLKKAGRGISFRLSIHPQLSEGWLAVVSKDACEESSSRPMECRYLARGSVDNIFWGRQLKCHLIRIKPPPTPPQPRPNLAFDLWLNYMQTTWYVCRAYMRAISLAT
jgi:hypothetical protein